jgi:HEPN domain-containing protein
MKDEREWLMQAADDLITAEALFNAGRYTHCIFFCHLVLEKSLKAVYFQKFKTEPPKTHNLLRLVDDTELQTDLPFNMLGLLKRLTSVSVPTRYPDDIRRMSKHFTKNDTSIILEKSSEACKWINELLTK